jgi:hypothetical protein
MSSDNARETRAFASETKFVVTHAVGGAIRDWARHHLDADPHGSGSFGDEYRTTTIYFDSPRYDVFHQRGSFGRSKFRIRRYDGSAEVFLERKLRRPGMLTKRRTLVSAAALPRLEANESAAWAGHWFHRRLLLRQLKPVCEISYHRVARAGMTSTGPIRLTIDEGLRVMGCNRPAFEGDGNAVPLLDACMIVELKYRAGAPSLFKQLVAEFGLRPKATSKYRLGMTAMKAAGSPSAAALSEEVRAVADGPPCG